MLTTDAKERKATPIFSGVLQYFPLALAEVARVSKAGNDQHNPGQPLHWDKSKSTDHGDCLVRHQLEAGTIDSDGQRHSAKVAWRALAQLETELEKAQAPQPLGVSIHAYYGDPYQFPCQEPGCDHVVKLPLSVCTCHDR